ncbi:spermidine/putrescine ABC transporter substrate-binding protein [Candidatus Babeliales bacterium]|nr:spermidine/putrescine ABC transporter substrate-binding protein [Candidatus Babeliales bacterium]
MIPKSVVKNFEKKTGISVRLKYFDSNEELIAKLKIDKGAGYDLITSSDYAIEILRKENLLKKIDKSRIDSFANLDSRFLNLYFDPENNYSIPIAWSVEGIVFKRKVFENYKNINWDFIFKKPVFTYKICMPDTPREVVYLTSNYLLNKSQNLTNEELEYIKNILIEQKRWVEIYMSGSLQYYLLANIVPMAVSSSAFAKKLLEVSNDFDFILPDQGSFCIIENLAIPIHTNKDDLVYQFINFLTLPQNSALNFAEHGYNPVNKKTYSLIDNKFVKNHNFFPVDNNFKKLYLIDNKIDIKTIEDLWLAVKLA